MSLHYCSFFVTLLRKLVSIFSCDSLHIKCLYKLNVSEGYLLVMPPKKINYGKKPKKASAVDSRSVQSSVDNQQETKENKTSNPRYKVRRPVLQPFEELYAGVNDTTSDSFDFLSSNKVSFFYLSGVLEYMYCRDLQKYFSSDCAENLVLYVLDS